MRIEAYFRQVDATITLCSRVALKTMLYDERSETKGFIIEVYCTYMREGRLMFRYDNSADITARDFATYPHHKHVGDIIQVSSAPSLAEVLAEIVELLQ